MSNDFLPFAVGGAANVETQSDYVADATTRQSGFQSGVANSAKLNKVWRQSSIMAAVLGQFAADYSGNNSTDDGTTATLEANLVAAIRSATKTGVILADTGAANAYTAVNAPPLVAGTWVDGVVQQVRIAHANTGASTYSPDGLTAIPIYGLGLQPLQGSELALNGIAILVRMTIAGVNSGNPIAVLMECAGGAQQVAPATQSQHAPQMGQVAGVVGSVRNLSMSVGTASATATLTADEIIVETALGGVRYCLPSFNKTINLATTGAGGMDTGAAPVSGFVALYAIYNPTTQTASLLAQNASTFKPNVYGGANMPAGYTASGLVAVVPTNASSQFPLISVQDRKVNFVNTTLLGSTAGNVSVTSLSIAAVVPANARSVQGTLAITSSTAATSAVNISSTAQIGVQNYSITTTSVQTWASPYSALDLVTPQTIFYSLGVTSGTSSFSITASSYSI